jgi:S-formylglutathione hydrolase
MLAGWSPAEIAFKSAHVFRPEKPPRFGLVFLHGIGLETLADNPIYTAILRRRHLACVCPHGQRSWWLDRVCAEFDPVLTPERYVLDHVVPFFRSEWNLAPPAVGVFGISMGGQGALRLAFRHPRVFPVAAGIASALDFHEWYGQGHTLDDMYDSKEQARQDTALMHIPPYNPPPHLFFCIDPEDIDWYRGKDRLHEKLSALGVPHTMDMTTSAGGHTWDYFNHMAEPTLQFLAEALEKESRRLL